MSTRVGAEEIKLLFSTFLQFSRC